MHLLTGHGATLRARRRTQQQPSLVSSALVTGVPGSRVGFSSLSQAASGKAPLTTSAVNATSRRVAAFTCTPRSGSRHGTRSTGGRAPILEPERGIEPRTYSLRVNRSTD